MEINIRDSDRIVEIWLSGAEKRDAELKSSLAPMYALYKDKRYTVAVFESGERGLFESTCDLLLYNRMLMNKEK